MPHKSHTEFLITAFSKDEVNEEGDDLDKIDKKLAGLKKSIHDEVVAKLFYIISNNKNKS